MKVRMNVFSCARTVQVSCRVSLRGVPRSSAQPLPRARFARAAFARFAAAPHRSGTAVAFAKGMVAPALRPRFAEPVGRFPGIPRRVLIALAIAVALVTGALFLTSVRLTRGAQVARLPPDQRSALYQRALADLTLCATPSGKLIKKHCEHQAELVVEFAECDATCRELAATWHTLPMR
jgi:hypothetical protein